MQSGTSNCPKHILQELKNILDTPDGPIPALGTSENSIEDVSYLPKIVKKHFFLPKSRQKHESFFDDISATNCYRTLKKILMMSTMSKLFYFSNRYEFWPLSANIWILEEKQCQQSKKAFFFTIFGQYEASSSSFSEVPNTNMRPSEVSKMFFSSWK